MADRRRKNLRAPTDHELEAFALAHHMTIEDARSFIESQLEDRRLRIEAVEGTEEERPEVTEP